MCCVCYFRASVCSVCFCPFVFVLCALVSLYVFTCVYVDIFMDVCHEFFVRYCVLEYVIVFQ